MTKRFEDPLTCSCGGSFELDTRFHRPGAAYAPGCEPGVARPTECDTCGDLGEFVVSSLSADGTNATREILTRRLPCPDCWRGRLLAAGDATAAL